MISPNFREHNAEGQFVLNCFVDVVLLGFIRGSDARSLVIVAAWIA